jgi:predicted dehydrogenase
MIKVGICGFGYWGPNLCRNFMSCTKFEVVAISDPREDCRAKARNLPMQMYICDDSRELIERDDVQAVAIATPAATHFALAAHALRNGKHVLVEKPLCMQVDEAVELVDLAKRHRLALNVDHVYLLHNAVRRLKKIKQEGRLGTVSYYDSLRVNLGLFQPDVNVLWDLAPHDFSIMDYIFEEEPVHIEATGYCHVNPKLHDIVYVTAHYASHMIAHLNLSWMSPVKVRRIAIGGSNLMAVWDDLNSEEPLKLYNSGIEFRAEAERTNIVTGYRIGDVYSPRVPKREALAGVIDDFAETILGNSTSVLDAKKGLRVVRMLQTAQAALDRSLREIRK